MSFGSICTQFAFTSIEGIGKTSVVPFANAPARHFGSRFTSVNFGSKKHDLGFALMNQLATAQKRFPKSEQDIASDFFALRKSYEGARWIFSEGTKCFGDASSAVFGHCGGVFRFGHVGNVSPSSAHVSKTELFNFTPFMIGCVDASLATRVKSTHANSSGLFMAMSTSFGGTGVGVATVIVATCPGFGCGGCCAPIGSASEYARIAIIILRILKEGLRRAVSLPPIANSTLESRPAVCTA